MKNLFKRIIAALTAATLAAGSVPLNMTASAQLAPVKVNGHGMLSSVSEEYIGYIDSGEGNEVGAAPSMLDISYLGESYAQLTPVSYTHLCGFVIFYVIMAVTEKICCLS